MACGYKIFSLLQVYSRKNSLKFNWGRPSKYNLRTRTARFQQATKTNNKFSPKKMLIRNVYIVSLFFLGSLTTRTRFFCEWESVMPGRYIKKKNTSPFRPCNVFSRPTIYDPIMTPLIHQVNYITVSYKSHSSKRSQVKTLCWFRSHQNIFF